MAAAGGYTAVFRHRVRDFMAPAPPEVAGDTPGSTLTALMARRHASAVIVTVQGRPEGIVTEQDVARRLLPDSDAAAAKVMSAPLQTIAESDLLYHAIARMRRAGLRHMPVVGPDGVVVGMLYLHEALAAAAAPMVQEIDRLAHDETLAGMADARAAQADVAEQLLRDGVPAPEVQRLISDINNDLYARVGRLVLAAMRPRLGDPPVGFCILVTGSGGRGESYLNPDQDNALILEDYPDAEHDRIDGWFRDFAERLVDGMHAIGLPYCPGQVMATNPLWRKNLGQWRRQMDHWIGRASPVTLLNGDIFFDFRCVYGPQQMADALRRHILARTRGNQALLQAMYRSDDEADVGLGLFNRLLLERAPGEHHGMVNLKAGAILPLVDAIRIYALNAGIAATATLDRIAELQAAGVLGADEADYLSGACRHVAQLLLRQQLADRRAGRSVGSYLPPAALTERERDLLVDSLKAIRALRQRLRADITGAIL